MTQEDLAQLSREELIQIILAQAEQLAVLQETMAQLKADNEALRLKLAKGKKPPTNSSNSSQPPSRDQKRSLPTERRKRKHGPPIGHMKHERPFVANPDHIVTVKAETCLNCHADLGFAEGVLREVNQITELPAAHAEVIEVRQYEVTCPECGRTQVSGPPAGLEMDRAFGARLEATVVYYRQEQHISYERTAKLLQNLHGVSISQGGIDQILKRAGKKAIQAAKTIQQQVCQSAIIQSDETGGRVDGSNWWQWVFCTSAAVLHVIRFNRSVDVIRDVMGTHQAEVWVSDCLAAQLKAPAHERQICLAHQLRNLQAVVDRCPTTFWARAMQTLFRSAIHLHHQRDQLPPPQFQSAVARIKRLCDWLIERPLLQPEAKRLQRRYQKYRQCLFVFLYHADVPPTNNLCERALRPSVIHRKVIGCFRSGWGARTYAALESVIDTAALSGINAFQAIQNLIGKPSLPLPNGV
jgi:transposase